MSEDRHTIRVGEIEFAVGSQHAHDVWVDGVRTLLDQGRPFAAFDLCSHARRQYADSSTLAELAARTMLRTGANAEAAAILVELCDTDAASEESFGLLGRAHKDRWRQTGERGALSESRDAYVRGFKLSRGIYAGINAATMSFILGETIIAHALAREVLEACDVMTASTPSSEDQYWIAAVSGEAYLLLGKHDRSRLAYQRGVEICDDRHGMLVSALEQLHLLADNGCQVPEELFEILAVPSVVAFSGHMIDAFERPEPRFPPHLETAVATAIAGQLDAMKAGVGFCSVACGSDILFAEAMLARGAQLIVVLPFALEDFVETSVRSGGADWIERMHAVLAGANAVDYVTTEPYLGDDVLFEFANSVIRGLAELRARALATKPRVLSVLDATHAGAAGGTQHCVEQWSEETRTIIDLADIRRSTLAAPTSDGECALDTVVVRRLRFDTSQRVIRTLLFADIVGYSRLQEEATPTFVRRFLDHVAKELRAQPVTPEQINTWGDAIFAVCDTAHRMVEYALALLHAVIDPDWHELGLQQGMNIRIALHAGPVFGYEDPITDRPNYYGSHINRAARLEPVTVPGCVYASEQFVALLLAEQAGEQSYDLHYVGLIELPKSFGNQRMYRIVPHRPTTASK